MEGLQESLTSTPVVEMERQPPPANHRPQGEPRFRYDSDAKTVTAGSHVWTLKDIPVHVMFEWIREGRIIKGVMEDWLEQKLFWKRAR